MRRFLVPVGLSILVVSQTALADPYPGLLHFSAHFGMSFAVAFFFYGFGQKGLGWVAVSSFLMAAAATLAVGFVYKLLEPGGLGPSLIRAMLENAVGIAAAGISIAVFQFSSH